MATVTGLTAERMQEIIDATITDADIVANHLILTLQDGSTIDAGVVGPAGKGAAFPAGATDGDLFVRTDIAGDPLYKYTDGDWQLFTGGGVSKGAAFPVAPAPTDGDLFVRTDQNGDPLYKYTDGIWELQPRMGALTVPAVLATKSGNQVMPLSTLTAISFDTESFDTDGLHDVAANNNRLTIKTPGLYKIDWFLESTAAISPSGIRYVKLRINGANDSSSWFTYHDGTYLVNGSAVLRLAAGDYVELVHFSDTAVTFDNACRFSATWLGGAGQTVDERGVPTVSVKKSANQSVANSVDTLISWDSEEYDTDGIHDTAVNNSRLVCKTPGLYRIWCFVWWATNTTGTRRITIGKNSGGLIANATTIAGDSRPSGAYSQMQIASTEVMLAAGDYIEAFCVQEAGAALDILGQPTFSSRFGMTLIGSGKTVTPFARVKKSAVQSLVTAGNSALAFDLEDADNDGIHDTATNNTRLTCRTAGVYSIVGCLQWAQNGSGFRELFIRKNGTQILCIDDLAPIAGAFDTTQTTSTIVELAVGDYVELIAWQNSGAGINAQINFTNFEMVKIGAPIAGQTGVEIVEANTLATLQNAWANGASSAPAGFYKDRGRVYLRGGLSAAAATAAQAFVLPVGYRPPGLVIIPVVGRTATPTNTTFYCLIFDTGEVMIQDGAGAKPGATYTNVMLDDVSFKL